MRKLLILVGTPLLLLAAGSLMMDMQTSAPGDQPRRGDSQSAPRYTIRNAEWTRLGSNGKTEFRINADRIDYYDDESARMTNVAMDGLAEGKGPWRLTSPLGQMPAHDKRILLTKPVVITGAMQQGGPVKMVTDQLWVDSAKTQLYTDAPVLLTRGNQQASAIGLNADWAGQHLQLLRDVKVLYVPNG